MKLVSYCVFVVAIQLAPVSRPSPVASVPPGMVINEFIKYHEPARYSREGLRRHGRMRRYTRETQPLRLSLRAHNREFQMVLTPDRSVFADDVVFENSQGHRLEFDSERVYTGTLEDDNQAVVSGVVTADGLFDGSVSTRLEDYYIEPVSRYLNTSTGYHSIIYRASDVVRPKAGCGSVLSGEPVDPNTIPFRSRVRRQSPTNRHIIVNSPNTVYHFGANRNASKLREEIVRDSLDSIRIIKVPGDVSIMTRAKGNNSIIPRFPETNIYNHPVDRSVYPNILVGNGPSDTSNSDDFFSRQHIHKRATVDPKKTTCMLYLQADHLFFQRYGTEESCIEVMTRHVQRVNSIYRYTDFNQDGKADNISFMIKRIKVHSTDSLQDPLYRFPGNYGVEKFLELFSEEDYDAFCLAYMFTYRDFEMGTLGLAWTGDLKNAGGVCEKNGHYRGSMKSLNTGIVTLLNYGKHVPPAVSHVTLAHEIGHNFGSPHDPEICTPGGDDGNFIMFARATSGDKKNNNQFSPCSLNSINPVLNAKARSLKGCFTEPQAAICGNGVVEEGEQCDCGWEEDCRDTCCFPQRRYPPPSEPPCHLTPNSLCSPSQGPCCTSSCELKFGDKCRDDNGCRDSSFCDGRGPYCPPSINKPNKTVCNDEFVCFMGECTGSICLAYGLESCQCIPLPHEPATKACELCCKIPGQEHPCLSSFAWNSAPYDIPDMFSKPGTPCNDYNGYCDVFHKCREVDPSGPLATLRKLLLSEESIASFKKWLWDRWYYAAMICSSVFLILVLSTRLFGKTTDLKIKAMTIIHSSTTETVRLPGEATGPGGGTAVVVHPVAVRSKLPLQRRARPIQRKCHNKLVAKKKKLPKSKKKSKEIIEYNGIKEKCLEKPPEEDPLGKVRNWLMNSHGIAGSLAVRKSKSSPAGFLQPVVTPRSPNKVNRSSEQRASLDANSKEQVKLQVVYKPPFKFSVKLKKPIDVPINVVPTNEANTNVGRKNRDAVLIQNYKKRKLSRTKQKVKPTPQQTSKECPVPKSAKLECPIGAATNDKQKQQQKENVVPKVKIISEKCENPLITKTPNNSEPIYQNTPIYQNLQEMSNSKAGLLRTYSASCVRQPERANPQKIARHHSVDGNNRESRSKNRQKDHKRYSLVAEKVAEPVSFRLSCGDSFPGTLVSKRQSIPLLDSDVDSNIHTMPSDMEVLLSESEYLFSDA